MVISTLNPIAEYMSRYLYSFLLLGVITFGAILPVSAQYTWENHGPDNIGSTTRALAYYNNGNAILAGSQGGGLWQSTNQGGSWQLVPGFDGNPHISSIAVDGSRIFVATGTSRFRVPSNQSRFNFPPSYDYRTDLSGYFGNLQGKPGAGVYVSSDNGQTWSNENGTTRAPFGDGTLSNEGPFTDIMKVASRDGIVLVATAEGLYFSPNNLESVVPVGGPSFIQDNVVFDIEFAAGGRVYASVHRDDNNPTDSIFVSEDNGRTFRTITDPYLYQPGGLFLANRAVRTELAVAPSNENILYVASTLASGEIAGVLRYDISTEDWTTVAPRGGAGFLPLGSNGRDAFVLEVFPDDENSLILAGQNWFTYSTEESWNQTAQHINPSTNSYIPSPIYSVTFDPNNNNAFMIGTDGVITRSEDRGATFSPRSKGYESTVAMTVSAIAYEIDGDEPESVDAILGGTFNAGVLFNGKYNSTQANLQPARQGFGTLSARRYTRVAPSLLHPGSLIIQGTDGGLVRSLNLGEIFETFYGLPILPQVANLVPATSDTIIDRNNANASGGGTLLNRPGPTQIVFALDEFIEEDLANDLLQDQETSNVSVEEALADIPSRIYFCSRNYVWVVNDPFGDLLQVRWNRISGSLVDGINEVFTAIEVADNPEHTLFLGTSNGNIFRIDRPHDLANFDVDKNITLITADHSAVGLGSMNGRWITDIAIDPLDPNRVAVTYAGYAEPVIFGWTQVTYNAMDSLPQFGAIRTTSLGNPQSYSAKFVEDGGESVLLVGTESGLYSFRNLGDISPINTISADITTEIEGATIYDIYQRPYRAKIRQKQLTRNVEIEVPIGDTVIVEQREVEVDQLLLERDDNIYLASYGRGYWSTNSLAARLRNPGTTPGDELLQDFRATLFPNPSRGERPSLMMNLPESGTVRVRVMALDGREVSLQAGDFESGLHTWPLELSPQLNSGMYLVNVTVQGETQQYQSQQKLLWAQP